MVLNNFDVKSLDSPQPSVVVRTSALIPSTERTIHTAPMASQSWRTLGSGNQAPAPAPAAESVTVGQYNYSLNLCA